jgi:hypothetical protein
LTSARILERLECNKTPILDTSATAGLEINQFDRCIKYPEPNLDGAFDTIAFSEIINARYPIPSRIVDWMVYVKPAGPALEKNQ